MHEHTHTDTHTHLRAGNHSPLTGIKITSATSKSLLIPLLSVYVNIWQIHVHSETILCISLHAQKQNIVNVWLYG